MHRLALLAIVAAACGDDIGDKLAYAWDGRQVVCSQPIDDYQTPEPWSRIDKELHDAALGQWVAIMHAHVPGTTISRDTLDRVLTIAQGYGLDLVTFRDFDSGRRRGGLALAFDDNAPDAWVTIRDLLAAHDAHVTFFVARYYEMTEPQHEELRQLFLDGNDLEPHTVNHLHGPMYVEANGMDAYLQNEVLPSFQVLVDAGYPPAAAFAYPFGERTVAMDDAILQYVDRVRTTPGPCPWK